MKQYEHTQHTDHHYNRHGARAGWSIWIWVFVSVCEYVLDALSHLLMQLDSVFNTYSTHIFFLSSNLMYPHPNLAPPPSPPHTAAAPGY